MVEVKRLNERVIYVKRLMGKRFIKFLFAFVPQTGTNEVDKDNFWDLLSSVIRNVPYTEMIVVGGDLNGYVGACADGYEGVHGGYDFGMRIADGERRLELAMQWNWLCETC